jgi:hypothetical protein
MQSLLQRMYHEELSSVQEIANTLNVGHSKVDKWMRKYNIKRRSNIEASRVLFAKKPEIVKRKWEVNENFFDQLTPESTYVMGLIAADGNLSNKKRNHQLRISLKNTSENRELLEQARIVMQSNAPIREIDKKKKVLFEVTSKIMIEKLIEYGITPAKTFTLKFPDIPDDQVSHFVRGF